MKRLLAGCICLLFFNLNGWTKNKVINLDKAIDTLEDRSLTPAPTASHDGNIISVYSDISSNEYRVTIKDIVGKIISSEIIAIFPQQTYTFSIENIDNGIYILELNDGKNKYRGSFEVYQ